MPSTFRYGAHVRANGIRQHYLRYGKEGQTPLVLVPGITSPAITWGFVAERLGLSFDTHVLDVRGRGLSESGPDLDYGIDACAADVAAFVEALALKNYVLLGHSMGARIAMRVAHNHRSGLGRLIMVDPPVTGPGRRDYPIALEWYLDSIRAMKRGEDWTALRAFTPTWSEVHVRLRAEWLHTCEEAAVAQTHKGFHEDDVFADLNHIKAPALLVVAGKGGTILPIDVAEIRSLIPDLAVRHVSTAGHMIPWDDFDGFFDAMREFLDR